MLNFGRVVGLTMEFILYLALILLCTKVAGDISVRLGQPAVLGKLIVGILIGPAVLGWIEKDSFITHVSEIGVLLLMFIAGLETDVEQLRKNWKSAFAVAVGGIILPFIGGYGAAIAFGFLRLMRCSSALSSARLPSVSPSRCLKK